MMLPSVALSMGSRTLHLRRKAGKMKRGISTYLQIGMVQLSFSRQHLLMVSKSKLREGNSGLMTSFSLMIYFQTRILKMLPYFLESKGWRFSMPQKEMLQDGLQTIRERGATTQLVFQEQEAQKLSRLSRRTGQRAIQRGPIQQYFSFLQMRERTNSATPLRKHSPSTAQYIFITIRLILVMIRQQEYKRLYQHFLPISGLQHLKYF